MSKFSVALFLFSLVAPSAAFTAFSGARSATFGTRRVHSSLHATLEAILFDCDGVLADTERDGHRVSFNRAFKANGIEEDWSVDRYGVLLEVGGGKERMTAHWNEVGWPAEIPAEGDERKAKVKELHLQKTDLFMDLIDEGVVPLRPGVLRIVDDAIASGVRLAVCSTSNELSVKKIVDTMGPERAAKFSIFAGDMVKVKKPAPDVYNMAVETMGLDPKRCIVVEDTNIGLQAAKGAGIKCVVTKSPYTENEDFSMADIVVSELGDDSSTGITLEKINSLL